MAKVFLIDGSALAYRSHFAMIREPLRNRSGMVTSAVYGFAATLTRLLETEKPDRIAVVFDSKEATFRHHAFPQYKAQREEMPDDLVEQLPYIQKLVEAMRIPFIRMPTFEADDIIGTLAVSAADRGDEAFIVSGDKDFLQLMGSRIKMLTPRKGGELEIVGEDGPVKKWGVPVEQVVDLLALMGDSSDNIPGVPGVGEKTASKLIHQFGSIEKMYERLEEVTPPKLRDKLREFKEQAELCKRLVTIDTKTPVPVSVEELTRNGFDIPRLTELYKELEFHSLLSGLVKTRTAKTDTTVERYILVDTADRLQELAGTLQKAPLFAFDTETTGLHPADAQPVGLSFSVGEKEAYYVPLTSGSPSKSDVLTALQTILEDPSRPKGGQNVKFDRQVLLNEGVDVRGVTFDTLLESYLLNPSSRQHNLDTLALTYLGIQKIPTKDLIGSGKSQISMLDVELPKLTHYACEDADITLRLHRLFEPQIEHQGLLSLYRDVELPLTEVLGDMERTGIAIDSEVLRKISKELSGRLEELTRGIHREAGEEFNINSPKQLGPVLFEKLRIQDAAAVRRVKKTQTGYSTDQETLEEYDAHPIVKLLLEYRSLSKLLSTYVDALPSMVHSKTGRIHTSFNQTVTATGRLSSSDPNLQNIPIRTELGREIRKAFVAGEKDWVLLSADYSQIELRILAHLSGDPNLIETFKNNEDVHRRTASLIFGVPPEKVGPDLRGRAKAINFGVIYGMGPQRLARETGISLKEAQAFIGAYFEKYSAVKRYLDRLVEQGRERGFVTTLLARKRDVTDLSSPNPRLASNAERIAINTPIQGSAADLIKVAMVNIHRRLKQEKLTCRMLLQVHDELVFELPTSEVPSATELIRSEMENAIRLNVPIVVGVGVGPNWADAH